MSVLAERRVGSTVGPWRLVSLARVDRERAMYEVDLAVGAPLKGRLTTLVPEVVGRCDLVKARAKMNGACDLVAAIAHDAVGRKIDDGADELGAPFVVTDVADGVALDHLSRRGHLPLAATDALALATSALDAIAATHDAGVLHLDVQPATLFIGKDARFRLLDFDHARPVASKLAPELPMPHPFRSPEVAAGAWHRIGPESDLYAVGAVVFFLVTGRAPDPRGPPPLASLVHGVDAELASLVDRALALDPGRRWTSAREMGGASQWVGRRHRASFTALASRIFDPGLKAAPPAHPPRPTGLADQTVPLSTFDAQRALGTSDDAEATIPYRRKR